MQLITFAVSFKILPCKLPSMQKFNKLLLVPCASIAAQAHDERQCLSMQCGHITMFVANTQSLFMQIIPRPHRHPRPLVGLRYVLWCW